MPSWLRSCNCRFAANDSSVVALGDGRIVKLVPSTVSPKPRKSLVVGLLVAKDAPLSVVAESMGPDTVLPEAEETLSEEVPEALTEMSSVPINSRNCLCTSVARLGRVDAAGSIGLIETVLTAPSIVTVNDLKLETSGVDPREMPDRVAPDELPVLTPAATALAVPPERPTGGVMSTTLVNNWGLAKVLPAEDLK